MILRIGHLAFPLPQVYLTAGNAALEVFQLMGSFCQLFCILPAGSFLILHPFPLSLKVVFAQGRILSLSLPESEFCVFLLLRLMAEFLFQFFQIHFRILKQVLELQRFGMCFQIGLSFHAQHILIIAAVLVANDRGIPHGRLKIPQRVLQRVHAFHGTDHGGEVFSVST